MRTRKTHKAEMRVLVANEPRSYREALFFAIEHLRPHLEVHTVDPIALDLELCRIAPHLVICNRVVADAQTHPLAWIELYPEGRPGAVVQISGQRRQVLSDIELCTLLSIIDQVQHDSF